MPQQTGDVADPSHQEPSMKRIATCYCALPALADCAAGHGFIGNTLGHTLPDPADRVLACAPLPRTVRRRRRQVVGLPTASPRSRLGRKTSYQIPTP